jgi:hypothetical protein
MEPLHAVLLGLWIIILLYAYNIFMLNSTAVILLCIAGIELVRIPQYFGDLNISLS